MKVVTDCFGRTMVSDPERRGQNWGNVCPFCQNVSLNPDSKCTNPVCVASQWATPEVLVLCAHRDALIEDEVRRQTQR